jgi:serine carboxypeptidase 1
MGRGIISSRPALASPPRHPLSPLAQLNSGPEGKVIPDSVTWGGQSDAVFSSLSGDFMRPVWDVADALLKGGRINVTVETGQLDLICCTAGTEAWMTKLTWPGMKDFYAASKTMVPLPNGLPGAFVKNAGGGSPLTMWYILNAGLMLPSELSGSPYAALKMISSIIGVPSPV